MQTVEHAAESVHCIAEEHESLARLYEQVLDALRGLPGTRNEASKLLDELVDRLVEHFDHEEEGGYYSQVLDIAPWRAVTVNELKRQHSELLRMARRVADGVRAVGDSPLWLKVVRDEFTEFMRRCAEHEVRENRLVQEVYRLNVTAAGSLAEEE